MAKQKPPPPVLDKGERAYFGVVVEEIEPELCSYCGTLAGRRVKATHVVVLTGWAGSIGARGRLEACKLHADQVANALRAEIQPRKRPAPASSGSDAAKGGG